MPGDGPRDYYQTPPEGQPRRMSDVELALMKQELYQLRSDMHRELDASRIELRKFVTEEFTPVRETLFAMRDQMQRWKAGIWVLSALGALTAWLGSQARAIADLFT